MWADFIHTFSQTADNLHVAADYINGLSMLTGIQPYLSTARFLMGDPLWVAMITTMYVGIVLAFIKIGKSVLEFVRSMIPVI